jgi:hypothetical protein
MLNFSADDKVKLTNYFVQYGIDLYGCVQAGYGWLQGEFPQYTFIDDMWAAYRNQQ